MHPWVGAGADDREHLLSELGLDSIDELFASIPKGVCTDRNDLPPMRDEDWIRGALGTMAAHGERGAASGTAGFELAASGPALFSTACSSIPLQSTASNPVRSSSTMTPPAGL